MDLFFKDKAEIFRWGPIPGRYFYVSEFDGVIFNDYLKLYNDHSWPNTLFLFKDDRMVWLNDFEELRAAGKKVFLKYLIDSLEREKLKSAWQIAVKNLSDFEQTLLKKDLTILSDEEFIKTWKDFYNLINKFWLPTIPAELGNYGSDRVLEEKLKEFISDQTELSSAMEILTAPEELSFYQEEEIDLIKTKDLDDHLAKYYWLKNSYFGVENLTKEFFEKRREEIEPNIEEKIIARLRELGQRKNELIIKYKLSKEVLDISLALCAGISWQDQRKKHIFIYIHYKEFFLKETARRLNLGIDSLRNCGVLEIIENFNHEELNSLINKRANLFGFFNNPLANELTGDKAILCWDNYSEEKIDKTIGEIKEFKGIVASLGKEKLITGKVRLVHNANEAAAFLNDEILVTSMTSPEFVFIMKRAKAIITDTGGLTSHAAILSRELHIPCIIGTKIATKVLHDGDLVELDINKGLIKIIK